ncbi:MAG TPA: hypothetical protein VFU63_07660 [Ktedonobacterales bacterium]|nr:hypothetical protein [Ktedonobacterales bacterium]
MTTHHADTPRVSPLPGWRHSLSAPRNLARILAQRRQNSDLAHAQAAVRRAGPCAAHRRASDLPGADRKILSARDLYGIRLELINPHT